MKLYKHQNLWNSKLEDLEEQKEEETEQEASGAMQHRKVSSFKKIEIDRLECHQKHFQRRGDKISGDWN